MRIFNPRLVLIHKGSLGGMAVSPSALRSGEGAKVHTKRANERRSQSPRSFTALAHLGLLCTPDENRHVTAG